MGGINLTRPFGNQGLDWFADLTTIYQDERFADQDNFTKWDAFWQVDAQLGLTAES